MVGGLMAQGLSGADAARLGVFLHGISRRSREGERGSDSRKRSAASEIKGSSRLSVFWHKQGIVDERIAPGHPEQNGQHERMHRTLKQETTRPAKPNLLAQQQWFDEFLTEFNEERPHEALDGKTPASQYTTSSREYRTNLSLEYPLHDDTRKVQRNGSINIAGKRSRVSS